MSNVGCQKTSRTMIPNRTTPQAAGPQGMHCHLPGHEGSLPRTDSWKLPPRNMRPAGPADTRHVMCSSPIDSLRIPRILIDLASEPCCVHPSQGQMHEHDRVPWHAEIEFAYGSPVLIDAGTTPGLEIALTRFNPGRTHRWTRQCMLDPKQGGPQEQSSPSFQSPSLSPPDLPPRSARPPGRPHTAR